MKRFWNHYLSMTLIASLFLLGSCGEDEEVPAIAAPTVTFEGTADGMEETATVDAGEEVSFTVNVVAPGGFNNFLVNKTVDGEADEFDAGTIPVGSDEETFTYNFSYTPTADEAGREIIFDFVAVDDDARETTESYTIMVNEQQVSIFPARLLYAPAADGSTESFFSAVTGETYSSDEVTGTAEAISPLIDFGYFYGETNKAVLAAPATFPFEVGQAGWDTRNATKLKKTDLTLSAFNETNSSADINAAFDNGTAGSSPGQVTQLAQGSVVAFETDPAREGGSRRGLIYVEEIQPGNAITNYIKIQVKVIE